jgi:hypothetical protein
MDNLDSFIAVLREEIGRGRSLDQIEDYCRKAGLPEQHIVVVLERLGEARPVASATDVLTAIERPRLLIDWSEVPRVGHQARPEFVLVYPPEFSGRPDLRIEIDRDLDHDDTPERLAARLKCEESQLWSVAVPFRLTTSDRDCRPGQYLIEVTLGFEKTPPGIPRFYRCQIRLSVPVSAADHGRELVIDGDGQSVVNLHGHDLKTFGRVVLRGSQSGIINLQAAAAWQEASANSEPSVALTREYQFKVDRLRERLLPEVLGTLSRPGDVKSGQIRLPGNRHILVQAKRQLTFGRHRDCDIVLRFLPRNADNDRLSGNISRKHFSLSLTSAGLLLRDLQSQTGLDLDGEAVRGERLLTAAEADDLLRVNVGKTVDNTPPLHLSIQMSGATENRKTLSGMTAGELEYFQALGERPGKLWTLGEQAGLDACLIRRINNLTEEEYLLCFRQVLIGSSSHCLLRLYDPEVASIHARLLFIGQRFLFENLQRADTARINGEPLSAHRLVALENGMKLSLGGTDLIWHNWAQLYL